MDRVGGHANLVETLKKNGEQETSQIVRSGTKTLSIHSCKKCKILILGRMGHGKSTLGNKIANSDGNFELNCEVYPQTCKSLSVISSGTKSQNYLISIYVHRGLFEGAATVTTLASDVPPSLNLLFYVLKSGHSFAEEERKILEEISSKWNLSGISALVLTHCEDLSEEERKHKISQFKKDHPSVAELMGEGILAVGFPDNSHIQPGSELSQRMEEDKKKLRQLIYSCDEPVHIPQPPQEESRQPPGTQIENTQPPPTVVDPQNEIKNTQPPRNRSRRSFRCSIL